MKKHIKNIIIIFVMILILELTVFNINSYRVLSSKKSKTFGVEDFNYTENDEGITFVQISDVNLEVKTVHIEVSNFENIEYEFWYSDQTTASLRSTPSKMYIDNLENSKYIATYLSGESSSIGFKLNGQNAELKSVTINERIPMNFSIVRVLILFFTITFIYCLRNLEIFIIPFSQKNLKQEFILLGVLGIFLCFICFINDYSREEKQDFYSYNFVKALSNGSVSLEEKPDERLLNMENPYDSNQRYLENIIRGEDYFWDTALYNGKVYVYFGILPVLILFLPYYLITGEFLFSAVGVLIFSVLSAIAIKALIEIVFTRFFKEIQFKYMVLSLIIIFFGSQILILNGIPRFYEVPISAGIFFGITGIDFVLMSIYSQKTSYIKMFIGTLFLALAVACRPTELLTSFIIVPILLKKLIENIKKVKNIDYIKDGEGIEEKKDIIKNLLAIVVPYLTVGILLMYYNYIRFGNVLEFGAKYQLTIYDMRHLSNRFASLGTGLICSLFSIPNLLPSFPFILNHNNLMTFYGYYYIENMIGGLFILVPICFAIFKLPVVCKKSKNRELVTFILSLVIVGFIICCLSAMMGGSMQRYIVDYGWMFILGAICTMLELHNIYTTNEAKHILKKIFAYLTFYIVFINLCSGIVSEKSYMRNNSPERFYEIKYTVDFWE